MECSSKNFITTLLAQKTETSVSSPIPFFIDPIIPSPRTFIQEYVFDGIAAWTKKGRYETTEEYKQRVTEENRQIYAEKLSKEAEKLYLIKYYGDVKGIILPIFRTGC